jgi:2-polyprenyl-3-methyl-5-hydroxy-6-metoxy-1,4-benzoquinol methylase
MKLDSFIADLRVDIQSKSQELVPLFDTFSQEALVAYTWLVPNLKCLNSKSEVLEVGAGLMILSCYLVKCGFKITALEPIGRGFSEFKTLQKLIIDYAVKNYCNPTIETTSIESFKLTRHFDFAFSVNVMEHVKDYSKAIVVVHDALKTNGQYRFSCPNYIFPYEPHFNIATLFNKKLTEFVFNDKIYNNQKLEDPAGVWESLNWISVCKINKVVKSIDKATIFFNTKIISDIILRTTTDSVFASRRSKWMIEIAEFTVKFKLNKLFDYLPASLIPIIDCTITRNS